MSLQGLRDSRPGQRFTMMLGVLLLLAAHRFAFLDGDASAAGIPLLDRWLYAPSMASPALAVGVFAFLVFRRRARIAAVAREGKGSPSGLVVLALGAAILLWSRQIGADHLATFSLVVHVVGVASFVGGARLASALASPLAVLLLAVPLPPEVLHQIVFPMQLVAAAWASFFLELLGRLHEVRGDLIYSGGTVFHVVEGCCGFKSTLSLVLAAIVYADVVLTRPGARLALAVAAVPLGLVANAVRVCFLVMGEIPTDSFAHTAYGILSIAGAVVVLALGEMGISATLAAARRGRSRPAGMRPRAAADSGALPLPSPRLWLAAAFVAVEALVAELVPIADWPTVRSGINIETLPERIAGRTASTIQGDDAFLGSVWFAHRIQRSYAADDGRSGPVRVFVGLEDVAAADRSGYSPKTVIPASGWQSIVRVPESAGTDRVAGAVASWEQWIVTYADRRTRILHRRIGYAPWGLELSSRWLGLDRAGVLGGLRSPLVIRLELDERGDERERGWMILRQVAEIVDGWYARAQE